MASCRRCSLLRMDESNRREPTLTTRPPRISGSTRASMETFAPPSTVRSESLSCCTCCGESGTAEVRACQQAGKIGTCAGHGAESGEVLGYLVEGPGVVRQLEKSVGIAAG